jgi:flavin reductase (DIM6/NTAB) family NADH-FMN oxidoreductase RutF
LLVAASLVIMSAAAFLPAVLAGSALMLLAGQVFAVSAQARVVQREPVELAGKISGFFTMATFGGVTVSTLAFPAVTWFGPVQNTFPWLVLAGSALAGAAAFRLRREYGDAESPHRVPTDDGAETRNDPGAEPESELDYQPPAEPSAGSVGRQLRDVGGQFATGVTIMTACGPRDPHGMTANSFATVSIDPPMVLVCVRSDARMSSVLHTGVRVGFSVLSSQHQDVAKYFAGSGRGAGHQQFAAHAWCAGPVTGVPVLEDSLAWLECEVADVVPAGDHNVILAKVLGLEVDTSCARPLVFFRGRFHAGVA